MNRPTFIDPHRIHAERAPAQELEGFSRRRIAFAIVFGPSGELIEIEDLLSYPFRNLRETRMPVPYHHDYSGRSAAQFLWGRTGDALGVRKATLKEQTYRFDTRAFENFRAYQFSVIQGVSDGALDAFLKFMDRWSPAEASSIANVERLLDQNIAFRFRYDDKLLHQQPAARHAWQLSRQRTLAHAGAA